MHLATLSLVLFDSNLCFVSVVGLPSCMALLGVACDVRSFGALVLGAYVFRCMGSSMQGPYHCFSTTWV